MLLGGDFVSFPPRDGEGVVFVFASSLSRDCEVLEEASESSVAALLGEESELVSGEGRLVGFMDMAFDRKSAYAAGGLIGVLTNSTSVLGGAESADTGVAVFAEVISEGNEAVTGVASFSSFGLVVEGIAATVINTSW